MSTVGVNNLTYYWDNNICLTYQMAIGLASTPEAYPGVSTQLYKGACVLEEAGDERERERERGS